MTRPRVVFSSAPFAGMSPEDGVKVLAYITRLEALRDAVEREYRSYDDEDRARLHMGGQVVDALAALDAAEEPQS